MITPPNVDPTDAVTAARTASEYWEALFRVWPIALTGGCVGVIMHMKEILGSKGFWKKIALTCSEWTMGGSAAAAVGLLWPFAVTVCPLPGGVEINPAAELGLCGFIGGAMGMKLFRLSCTLITAITHWFARRVLGYDEACGECEKSIRS